MHLYSDHTCGMLGITRYDLPYVTASKHDNCSRGGTAVVLYQSLIYSTLFTKMVAETNKT